MNKRRLPGRPFDALDDPDETPDGAVDPSSSARRLPREGEAAPSLDCLTRSRRHPTRPETDCDPSYVLRGTLIVEANARIEGERHAAKYGRMRIQEIPEPFAPAYVEGFWHALGATDDPS